MPAFYRQSIQNAVNQQINIGKSKHRTTLNREAIGQDSSSSLETVFASSKNIS